jgi:hypothetical protein
MPAKSVRVVDAEVIDGAVLIRFSDHTSALFHAEFLYEVQGDDGNISSDELLKTFGDFDGLPPD